MWNMYKGNKNCRENKCNNSCVFVKILAIVICAAVVFWLLACVSAKCLGFYIGNDQIIVTLLGILATFVVVSNYAQVENIKRDIEQQLVRNEKINQEQKEFLDGYKELMGQYLNVKILLDDIKESDENKKIQWCVEINSNESFNPKFIVEEPKFMTVKDINYNIDKDEFVFEPVLDKKKKDDLSLHSINPDACCDFKNPEFRFLLRMELQKLGKVK